MSARKSPQVRYKLKAALTTVSLDPYRVISNKKPIHSSHIYKSDIKQEVKLIFVPWLAGKGGNSRYTGGTSASTPCP